MSIEKVKLGALVVGGQALLNPKKPWGYERTHTTSAGDIPEYKGGVIEIIESDDAEALISWIPIEHEGKQLLIADRNLLTRISWDQLNEQELIFGKEIEIDGKRYKLRVLNGGNSPLDGDYELGGFPENNEWDSFIANKAENTSLPIPTEEDLDEGVSEESFEGEHNQFWNWAYAYSWCQDTHQEFGAYRVFRGYHSARNWDWNSQSDRNALIGWRPCLELLNSDPLNSGNTNVGTNEMNAAEAFHENRKILAQLINKELRKLKDETNAHKKKALIDNIHELCRTGKALSEFERG